MTTNQKKIVIYGSNKPNKTITKKEMIDIIKLHNKNSAEKSYYQFAKRLIKLGVLKKLKPGLYKIILEK